MNRPYKPLVYAGIRTRTGEEAARYRRAAKEEMAKLHPVETEMFDLPYVILAGMMVIAACVIIAGLIMCFTAFVIWPMLPG
jgi:uncharacterized membrane protein